MRKRHRKSLSFRGGCCKLRKYKRIRKKVIMKLKIENIGKIKNAEVRLDGLTVICGKNNTGKSTIGKILYAAFNSLYDIEKKVKDKKQSEISRICNELFQKIEMRSYDLNILPFRWERARRENPVTLAKWITNNESIDENEYSDKVFELLGRKYSEDTVARIREINFDNYSKILEIIDTEYKMVAAELIGRYFNTVFSNQVNKLDMNTTAAVNMEIKKKVVDIAFKEDKCMEWKSELLIGHEAFFIDAPFIIDQLNRRSYVDYQSGNIHDELINRLLKKSDDIMDDLFGSVSRRKQSDSILAILDSVACGKIAEQEGTWGFLSPASKEAVKVENLSTGLKSFMIIRLLLEKGILKEKDVLILDEPEIHLHPEWQLNYAEIIVLLQKYFDLTIIVTTHSSHFLEALNYYAKKHQLSDKCNYYLAESDNSFVGFKDMTDNLEKIYAQLISPSMLLDELKYEMDESDEE